MSDRQGNAAFSPQLLAAYISVYTQKLCNLRRGLRIEYTILRRGCKASGPLSIKCLVSKTSLLCLREEVRQNFLVGGSSSPGLGSEYRLTLNKMNNKKGYSIFDAVIGFGVIIKGKVQNP